MQEPKSSHRPPQNKSILLYSLNTHAACVLMKYDTDLSVPVLQLCLHNPYPNPLCVCLCVLVPLGSYVCLSEA